MAWSSFLFMGNHMGFVVVYSLCSFFGGWFVLVVEQAEVVSISRIMQTCTIDFYSTILESDLSMFHITRLKSVLSRKGGHKHRSPVCVFPLEYAQSLRISNFTTAYIRMPFVRLSFYWSIFYRGTESNHILAV